ncbi:MAG TPA: FCD domain-containing protein, partial [Methylomirabilota bacterium]|nr:FCD domain-containing protein [Methylomirabilota bacterium]
SSQLDAVTRHMQLPLIMLQVRRRLEPAVLFRSVEEHRRIARAILDGDAKAAEREMRAHLGAAARIAGDMHPDNGP